MTADSEFSAEHSQSIAIAVREALARRRISRQTLAEQARISLSTLEKALSGRRPFTLATTIRLEEALGTNLRQDNAANTRVDSLQPSSVAPEHLGSYGREAVSWLAGDYLTLRPSFGEAGAIFAYRTEIFWNPAESALEFRESDRLDLAFKQAGKVSVSNQSGHIYLVTVTQGQYRLAVLGRSALDGTMYGVITTLRAGRGTHLTPVSASIAMVPLTAQQQAGTAFGRIHPGHGSHAYYKDYLRRVTQDEFAIFMDEP